VQAEAMATVKYPKDLFVHDTQTWDSTKTCDLKALPPLVQGHPLSPRCAGAGEKHWAVQVHANDEFGMLRRAP